MFKFAFEIPLRNVDGISCIKTNPWRNSLLAISTWNELVNIYDIQRREIIESREIRCPQLAVEWISEGDYASGGADGIVYINGVQIGYHNAAISGMAFCESRHILATSSYDGFVKFWNTRTKSFITDFDTRDKVFSIAYVPTNFFVCGCTENRMIMLNIDTHESNVYNTLTHGYNTRYICSCETMIAVSVAQGRITIINPKDTSKKYAFKAHIDEKSDSKIVYPINAMCFQPKTNYLATGGTDAIIYIWDVINKCKIDTLFDENGDHFQTSISSLSFTRDGHYLVAAISYCFEQGSIDHAPDRIVVYESIQD